MSTTQEQFNHSLIQIVEDAHKHLKEEVSKMGESIKILSDQQKQIITALKGNEFSKGCITQHAETVQKIIVLEDKVSFMDTAIKLKEASIKGAIWMAGIIGSIFGVITTFLLQYFSHGK